MAPIPLRIGGYQGPKSILTAGLNTFTQEAERHLGDAIAIEQISDVTQGGESARALFDGIESGAYHMGYMASGYLTARVPALAVIDLPFSQSSRPAAHAALDGAAGHLLRAAITDQTGLSVMGFWDNGFRHITNHLRPIQTPADCHGLVVRTLDNRIYQDTMAAMGFTPLVTDVRDLRDAVMSGRVDAQENPLANTVVFALHDKHKHLSLTGHFFGVVLFVANADWLAALPPKVARALSLAAKAATAEQRRLAALQDTEALDAMRAQGVAVVEATDLDLATFKAACADIIAREREKLGPEIIRAYLG